MLGEQFTISIDFVPQGKTSPPDPARIGTVACGKDVQDCIKRGWSNGRFIVPEGQSYQGNEMDTAINKEY